MAGRWKLLTLALCLSFTSTLTKADCPEGFIFEGNQCIDDDECTDVVPRCPENSHCKNTIGNFSCPCDSGFRKHKSIPSCEDINECAEDPSICGLNAQCFNTIPQYYCKCLDGFISSTGKERFHRNDSVTCRDICIIDKTICGNGTCHHGPGGHYCACHPGFTNYGKNQSRCTALDCYIFKDVSQLSETFHVARDLVMQLKKICLELSQNKTVTELDGDNWLQKLLSIIDKLLSGEAFKKNKHVSTFLDLVENSLRLIAPLTEAPRTNITSAYTELELLVRKGNVSPRGAVTLSSTQALVDIEFETAAGKNSSYPGFTTVSLLSYANLEKSADGYFEGMKPLENQSYAINSKVVTVTVSNRNTSHLEKPVNLTFYHLKESPNSSHTCVFWDSSDQEGTWSTRGCSMLESTPNYTVCSCSHLSSFAVLMALYDIEDRFDLKLITWVGLSLSLACLLVCILTFSSIRSIQSPRTTIHLHLCISLFIAFLIFLAGISRTENRVGCAVVAGLLHFFFLAAFCWMCLEGIQLFRMVVLVFNTNFKTLYMMAGGYGVPAVIVGITALVNAKGYGTVRYCWLNLESIWSFFAPVCIIITVNVFFFLITVWKLAQKFSSLNPDLDSLQKIQAFTITAVAQLCVLGTMWIFGCFQFEKGTIAMSYLFTIFASFQGVLLFVMHCLFSKQVRDEYGNILSRCCAPRKKAYSEFSSHSSKAHASKSTQDTGESHI